MTWVDLDEVAEAASVVLCDRSHAYATYELVGQDAFLRRAEIATLMSRVLGRDVRAVKTPVGAYLETYRRMPLFARMNEEELAQIRAMFVDYDNYGMPSGNAKVLSMLLGHPAGNYVNFLERLAKAPPRSAGLITSYGLPGN